MSKAKLAILARSDDVAEPPGMEVEFRPGTPEDADTCGSICFEAFKSIAEKHNFPPDFTARKDAVELAAFLLAQPNIYSVVAELDGRVVGSNFLWETPNIAGVGPITVDVSVQNAAVGRRMMESVLQRAREQRFAGVRLVQAAYHCRSLSLYSKLGFDGREPLSTMQGPAIKLDISGHRVRRATETDLAECDTLSMEICGHDRSPELLQAIRRGKATLVEHNGAISGYATSIGYFGHAVGRTNEDLKALIGRAKAFEGPGFLLPTRNGELLRWCLRHGLRIVQPMTLMSLGLYNEPKGAFLPSIIY